MEQRNMHNVLLKEAKEAAQYIKQVFNGITPKIAVILGSGLGAFIDTVKVIHTVKYSDIPYFPSLNVVGHKGQLSIVEVANKLVLVMEGRFHSYEGYSPQIVTFPIVVFHLLGIKKLIVSSAAGGINSQFQAGDLMIVNDHINFTGNHPLIGKNNNDLGVRFLDQTECYSKDLIDKALATARELGIKPKLGVYLGTTGPTYETKAEINAFRTLGADAVGMSTVYEVIMGNYFKMQILAISSITNMATGIATTPHDHAKVVEAGNQISAKFSNWVKEIIRVI